MGFTGWNISRRIVFKENLRLRVRFETFGNPSPNHALNPNEPQREADAVEQYLISTPNLGYQRRQHFACRTQQHLIGHIGQG